MKTINILSEIKFANIEASEVYVFENIEGMKIKKAILEVSDKSKSFGSGKKSVFHGIFTLEDNEGKKTVFEYHKSDNKGLDVTTLKNKLMGANTTTQRGQRKAEDFEALAKLFDDVKNTLAKIEDYLTEEEANDADLSNIYNKLTQAKDASVARLEASSKQAKANQEKAMDFIKRMTPEQIAQFLQMQKAQ